MKSLLILVFKFLALTTTLFLVSATATMCCCGVGGLVLVFSTLSIPVDPIKCFFAGACSVGVVVLIAWVKILYYEQKHGRW